MKLSEQIEGILNATNKLLEFQKRLGDSEESEIFDLSAKFSGDASASVYFFTGINRDKALAFIGDNLGREGWLKKLDGSHYDWSKEFLGVRVKLYEVQQINALPVMPVDPKEFPIQLEDVKPC